MASAEGTTTSDARARSYGRSASGAGDAGVDPKGYVWVKAPKGHPNARGKSGWIMEHVLVMSTLLGRPLRKGEQVHHKNLIKSDNRPENLELWNTNQPTGGQSVRHAGLVPLVHRPIPRCL